MSSLLSTMAILLANYDEQRDYLSNFEPFVLDRLKAWPAGDEVRPTKLREQLSETFSLPPIPINTVTTLRDRIRSDGYLRRRTNGKFFTFPDALAAVEDISAERTEVLTHFNALYDAVRAHAKDVFELDWSELQVEAALESFVEEFGIEMAMARQEGGLAGNTQGDEALAVVHSFARRAVERDPTNLGYLEEMVKGSMLTNVIYFQDLGDWVPTIQNLVVYLDTPFVLRALEVAPEEISTAALELLRFLADFKIPVRVFDHTIEETIGVLGGVQGGLIRARRGEMRQEDLVKFNQETVEHLLRKGWGPGDIEALISDIDRSLGELGIIGESPPEVTRDLAVNEPRFEDILTEKGYTKEPQKLKDVRSLTAVHRIRQGHAPRGLSDARAIFVTTNPRLVRASREFFSEQGIGSPVPHCISDISLTTQLWLRRPGEHPDVPRKLLMAESFAALSPSTDTWWKYLQKIEQKRRAGEIDDQQVKVLVLSNAARESLIEITRGHVSEVTDETPLEVLDRYGDVLRRPTEEAVAEANESLKAVRRENELLRAEGEKLREDAAERDQWIASQDRQIGNQAKQLGVLQRWKAEQDAAGEKRQKATGVVRAIAGSVCAVVLILIVVLLGATERVTNPLQLSVYGLAAGTIAVFLVGWGFKKPGGWGWKILGGTAILGGLLGLLYGVFLGELGP